MTIEYVVRRATLAPDLEWVAVLEVGADGVGELRHKGGLEGQVDAITGPAHLERLIADYASAGCQVDVIPRGAA